MSRVFVWFVLILHLTALSAGDWYNSLAIQAASWGAPLVTMYALRAHDALGPHPKARPNEIWRMEDLSTPALSKEAGYVTPNVNVIYGFGFMDLRKEPVILEVPDSHNRYYMVEIVDMWTNAFAYVGGKTTGYQGGTFALVGPGWKGELPAHVKRIDCPTPWVLLQPRVHIYENGKLDLASAKKILNGITTKGAREKTYHYLMPEPVNPDLPVSALHYKDPLQFWELLMVAMNENPPPEDQVKALLPMFKPLGIELGKSWDRTKLSPEILKAMTQAASEIGEMLSTLPFGQMVKGAVIPAPTIGNFGTDYLTRAVVGRVGLTANTPYESVYWMYTKDEEGNQLMGNQNYKMTFKEGIPYYEPGFWSITLYDAKNNYTVTNKIQRYMLGSDSKDLKKNKDGSFTIYIQEKSPGKEMESNWLPTPPGPFYLVPRSYAPKPETIRILTDVKAWPVPFVVPAGS
jgi:DNA sulfur modification protein DndE